jgi:transposase
MEETLLHEIFGVSKSYHSTKTEIKHGGVFVAVEPLDKLYSCPGCRSRDVIRKGQRIRRVQTLPIGFHPVYLEVQVPRCQCKDCQHIFEIAPPFARLTRTTPKR